MTKRSPEHMKDWESRVQVNTQETCSIDSCGRRRTGYSRFCRFHLERQRYYGNANGRKIPVKQLQPTIKALRALFRKHNLGSYPAYQHGIDKLKFLIKAKMWTDHLTMKEVSNVASNSPDYEDMYLHVIAMIIYLWQHSEMMIDPVNGQSRDREVIHRQLGSMILTRYGTVGTRVTSGGLEVARRIAGTPRNDLGKEVYSIFARTAKDFERMIQVERKHKDIERSDVQFPLHLISHHYVSDPDNQL